MRIISREEQQFPRLPCEECKKDKTQLVAIGMQSDHSPRAYDFDTPPPAWICADCLRRALALVTPPPVLRPGKPVIPDVIDECEPLYEPDREAQP